MESRREGIELGGAWAVGDASLIPPGYCLVCRNMLVRPNKIDSRPPMVYDSLMSIRGLFNFDDQTNKVSRLMALNATPNLFMKGTSGETWSSSLGTPSGTRLTDSTRYRGKVYYAMDNGSGVPTAINSFDGTNLSSAPFNSSIFGRCVTAYLDRLFIAYPRVTFTAYPGYAARYTGTRVNDFTISTSVDGSATTYKVHVLSGASGTDDAVYREWTLAAATVETPYVMRQDIRSRTSDYEAPLRLQLTLWGPQRANLTAYDLNAVVVESNGAHRVKVAGTTAAADPGISGNLTTLVDGTVTWEYIGPNVRGYTDFLVPTVEDNPEWVTYFVTGAIPAHSNTLTVRAYLASYTAFTSSADFDIGYADGTADGTIGKDNKGFQFTLGDFHYPFINTEATDTASLDLDEVIWSEVLDVKKVIASQTYRLPEVPGFPTAAATVGGRYLVHKRNGFWVFNGNQDLKSADVIPIRRERIYKGVGCIGPRAHDNLNDVHYFIGEDDVYAFEVGKDPVGICGPGMREEIMDRGSNWVESQATYNMPILRIDQRQKEVWVYTQKGTLYCYNIDRQMWSSHDVDTDKEIADIAFNPNTRKMYFAIGGYGLARMDWSASPAKDTFDDTEDEYDVTCDLVARPLELFPDRVDSVVDHFGLYHLATASQSGQRLIASASFDRGVTFTYTNEVLLDITDERNEIPLYQSGPSITLKLSSIGKTGPTIYAISKLDAEVIVLGGEWPQVKPSTVSASL